MITTKVSALEEKSIDYHSIEWLKCHLIVKRLQARIVKAVKLGRWGKVKSLQRILTRSFSAKALAVRRVTENRGKKTPGVDGEVWKTPTSKGKAIFSLNSHGYKPLPVRRIYISKERGGQRPLGIPTMKDRAMQTLHLLALDPIAETLAEPYSYGFRSKRSTADAIERCFGILARKYNPEWVLEADIKGCFDNISHKWLIENIPMDKHLLTRWLKAGIMEKNRYYFTKAGTPQGGVLSPVIANMALDGISKMLEEQGVRGRPKAKVNLARYADDFVITGSTPELLEQEVKPLVNEFLKVRGLELSTLKTKITHINDGFDFLGQNIRKYHGKLLIKPSKLNYQCFLKKVRKTIKENKTANQLSLINLLNPLIRGWANYHKHVVAKDIFLKMDYIINFKLWQWAKRRHKNKGANWIKKRYFSPVHNWGNFTVTYKDEKGRSVTQCLAHAGKVQIIRHCIIKSNANPYDPEWDSYFKVRRQNKLDSQLKRMPEWKAIFDNQNGICPHCKMAIKRISSYDIYTDLLPEKGGNKVIMHKHCRQAVTAKRIRPA
jgi:RNA-directed DNA polymerase